MSTGNVINIGTRVDLAALRAGMQQAEAAVKAASDNMAAAQDAFGKSAEAGNLQAVAALKQYETELRNAQAALAQYAGSERAAESATRSSTSARMAAAAEFRMLEGNVQGSTRAAAAFASTIPGVGAAMQLAFPVFGAIAVLEILGKSAEAAHHLFDEYVNLRSIVNLVNKEVSEEQAKEIQLSNEHLGYLRQEQVLQAQISGPKAGRSQRGREAGDIFDQAQATSRLALAQSDLYAQRAKMDELQQRAKGISVSPLGGVQSTEDAKFAQEEMRKQVEVVNNANGELRNAQEQLNNSKADARLRSIQEDEKLGTAGESAARKASEAKIKAMQEGLQAEEATWGRSNTLSANYWADQVATTRKGSLEYAAALKGMQTAQAAILTSTNEERLRFQKESAAAISEVALEASRPMEPTGLHDQTKAVAEWAQAVNESRQIADDAANAQAQVNIQVRAAQGGYTAAGRTEAEAALHTKEYSERLAELQKKLADIQGAGYLTSMEKNAGSAQIQNQMASLNGQMAVQTVQDQAAKTQAIAQPYLNAFNSINSSWLNVQNQLIFGTRNVGRAFANMGVGILESVAQSFEKMLLKSLESELQMTIARQVANQAKVASDAQAATQSKAITMTTAFQEITASASKAAAAAYASTAVIPFVGPILAPVAAGAAFTAVEALAAFETGGIIPNTGVALVHQGEAVLPAQLTNMLMNTANDNSSTSATQTIHFHGTSSKRQFEAQLAQSAGHVLKSVQRGLRSKGRI